MLPGRPALRTSRRAVILVACAVAGALSIAVVRGDGWSEMIATGLAIGVGAAVGSRLLDSWRTDRR